MAGAPGVEPVGTGVLSAPRYYSGPGEYDKAAFTYMSLASLNVKRNCSS